MEAQIRRIASTYLEGVRPTGESGLRSKCPLCGSDRSFIISLHHGGWICWSCGERGALVTLLRQLGLSSTQVDRTVEALNLPPPLSKRLQRRKMLKQQHALLPEYILGAYEGTPEELVEGGFSAELLRKHDVGVDAKNHRITFPIRDTLGRLAGISGRARGDWQIPRYKVYDARPPDPERNRGPGELYGVVEGYVPDNRAHLYGFNDVYPERYFKPNEPQPPLVVTEGYKSTLWMRQLGFTHTVGLQGSSMTAAQERQLGRLRGPYYIMLDNEPGKAYPDRKRRCAAVDIARRLRRSGQVFLCIYPEEMPIGAAPDDIGSAEEAGQVLETAETIGQLRTRKRT